MAQGNDTPQLSPDATRVLRDVRDRGCVVLWSYQAPYPYYGNGKTQMPKADYDILASLIKTTSYPDVGYAKGTIEVLEHGNRNGMRYTEKWVLPPNAILQTTESTGDFTLFDKQAALLVSSELESGGVEGEFITEQHTSYNRVQFHFVNTQSRSDYVEFVDATDEFTDDDGDSGVYERAVLKPLALRLLEGVAS